MGIELTNQDSNELLAFLLENGTVCEGDIQKFKDMRKRKEVLQIHPYAIAQGNGRDKRWYTRINENTKGGAKKKVARKTEKELFDYLYDYYYGHTKPKSRQTLGEIYPEWLDYKKTKGMESTTLHRIDTDYRRFYIDEPLSSGLMTTPMDQIRKIDIEKWAYSLIRKYNLTYKAYTNMAIIIKQVLDYMVDQGVIETNPYKSVKIDGHTFRRVRKKPAESQIFYDDEMENIIKLAEQKAEETEDEQYYAIVLLYKIGLRIGECLGLSYDDFCKAQNLVNIHASLKAIETQRADGTWETRRYEIEEYLKHNAEPRDVLITDECFEIVEKIRQLQEKKGVPYDGYLFHCVTPSNLENKIARICRTLGIPVRSAHKIRKTYISKLLNNQTDLDFVRSQVGHKEDRTTLNSYTFSTTRKEAQLQKLESVL